MGCWQEGDEVQGRLSAPTRRLAGVPAERRGACSNSSGSCLSMQFAWNPTMLGYSRVFLNGVPQSGQVGTPSPGFSQTCGT